MKKLRVIQHFYGNQDEKLKAPGEEFTAPNARAEELEKLGLVEVLEDSHGATKEDSSQAKHKK